MRKYSTLKTLALAVGMLFLTMDAAAEDVQFQVTIPSTGHLAFKPERNFTGPAGVIVSNFYGSSGATSAGLRFNNTELGDGVVISHTANSTTPVILTAKPGTYTLTYTDATATVNHFSTSAYWTDEATVTISTGDRIYKFVNTAEKVGFQRDETYASTNYKSCDFAAGEHCYTRLGENPLKRIKATMEITEEPAFIPWSSEMWGCPVVDTSGISSVSTATTKHDEAIYNLQGQRLAQMQRGLNIVGGRKVMMK